MLALDALPWDIIAIVLGLSIFIPSIIAILLIKVKRYEDVGTAIGIFLILLGSISYFYVIPNQVVDQALLPENYFWEDEGNVQYWERNSVFFPDDGQSDFPYQLTKLISKRKPIERNFIGREVIHAISYDENNKEMVWY